MSEKALAALRRLHDEVDRSARRLEDVHADRLECKRGCCQCCIDGITVFEIEAERIRQHDPDLLRQGRPHPEGACAFLDEEGACRIYEVRPYVCRTQGLPLRWLEDEAEGVVEMRDICPLNDRPEEPLLSIEEDACFTIGPFERRLAELQRAFGGDGRVRLRDLFHPGSGGRRPRRAGG